MSPASHHEHQEQQLIGLMIAYQQGDLGAFEQLYAILVADVRRYFARDFSSDREPGMAHDLTQDLFLEMHRSRRTYTPPLPVRPWVFGIARHVAARNRRASQLRPRTSPLFDAQGDPIVSSPAAGTPSTDSLDMERALADLPAGTRDPWLMHHAFGFSFDSIAARLGITVMGAKLRSSRATRALRLALRGEGKSDDA